MDRIIAIIIIVIISPVLLVLLFITMINLKANPIFIQNRTVDGTSEFAFYKLRTMSVKAPIIPTADFKDAESYITPWGSLMRMYSFDELFNLICIVKGDMKFIGPRPIMPCEYDLLNLRLKYRIRSKAGITGLAQVNGRDVISLTKKVVCERYYEMRKKSLILRISILLKTIYIVLKKSDITH